jgi:hypothetical protein
MLEKIYLTSILFTLLGCGSLTPKTNQTQNYVPQNFVPSELHANDQVLLIKSYYGKGKHFDHLADFLKAHYKGKHLLIPRSASLDRDYPDAKKYRFVMVIEGAIDENDFNGISQMENFSNPLDSSFTRKGGSALFIYDRISTHALYDTGEHDFIRIRQEKNAFGQLITNPVFDHKRLKRYLELLNPGRNF